MDWLNRLFPNAKILGTVGGVIPVSGNLEHYVADSLALVGDAAHHTNPLTGGGISAAMRAGRHAAKIIGEGLRTNNLSKEFLLQYETLVEEDFGKSHRKQLKFRRFLLEQNKEDQVNTYHFLNAALGKNGKKLDLLMHPMRSLKVIRDYIKFK